MSDNVRVSPAGAIRTSKPPCMQRGFTLTVYQFPAFGEEEGDGCLDFVM